MLNTNTTTLLQALNKRNDGRQLMDFRDASLNLNTIHTADGSAAVKLGNTAVICGIKAVR